MNFYNYKPDGDTVTGDVDPIELIKSLRSARAKKVQNRAAAAGGIAIAGVFLMAVLHANGVIVCGRSHFPDTSFTQRVCAVWYDLLAATIAIAMLAALRVKLSDFISEKARTPCNLIGVIGLGVLVHAAADFFPRPYTGTNITDLNWHFIGGWFLVLWGIVFRK